MDTARYKAFLTAVETGSFAAAAKQMDYTVSGVSQLVAALEKECVFPCCSAAATASPCRQTGNASCPWPVSFSQKKNGLPSFRQKSAVF